MGKTRDLFKKMEDIKGIFHARMSMIKDRKSKDLTEAEEIKKRWQEYTELYKKGLNDLDNHDGVVTHLELDMEQQTGSKQEKEYIKAVYCHPAYLTYAEYIMRNAGLDKAGIKIARRNISNLRYADDTTLTAESEEELKSLLMKVKEDSEKVGLKAQHSEN